MLLITLCLSVFYSNESLALVDFPTEARTEQVEQNNKHFSLFKQRKNKSDNALKNLEFTGLGMSIFGILSFMFILFLAVVNLSALPLIFSVFSLWILGVAFKRSRTFLKSTEDQKGKYHKKRRRAKTASALSAIFFVLITLYGIASIIDNL